MSLFEWFFESANPGQVGKVEINPNDPNDDGKPPKKWLIYIVVVIGLLLTSLCLYWVFRNPSYDGVYTILIKLSCLALYVTTSQFIAVTPENKNIGWLGGLIDNPFRISDDFNRWLLFLQVFLLPGKLIAYSLAISWILIHHLFKKYKSSK